MFRNETWLSFFSNSENKVSANLIIGAAIFIESTTLWFIIHGYINSVQNNNQPDDVIVEIPAHPIIIQGINNQLPPMPAYQA